MAYRHEDRPIRTMRSTFSTAWGSSRQPRKQRKYIANAPLHVKHNFLSAHLSKELRAKHKKRSVAVRKGDEVLVMRGTFAEKKAKVSAVDTKKTRVMLEGITRSKRDGSKVNVFFHPSNLQIIALHADDKQRFATTNAPAKPAAKPTTTKTQEKKHASN